MFESADIFVFPTFYSNECFPLVLLEAMQHGLPCVTTDEGGIRDIVVEDSGFTVHGSDAAGSKFFDERSDKVDYQVSGFMFQELAEGTADALEKLIVNVGLRKKMGEAGKQRVLKMFTEEKFEERMVEILSN